MCKVLFRFSPKDTFGASFRHGAWLMALSGAEAISQTADITGFNANISFIRSMEEIRRSPPGMVLKPCK